MIPRTMPILSLFAASIVAAQGQAVELSYPNEPDLVGIETVWKGFTVPFAKRGDTWLTVIGVDLDTKAGDHAAVVTFHYKDGHSRTQGELISVTAQAFPTTELKVEERYVQLSPEDEARAREEGRETADIYATLTPEIYWMEPFIAPIPGAKDGRNFGHRRIFNGEPRAPHGGADLRATTGTPIYAANRGRIVLAKDLFYSGNAVFIDHGLGLYTTYLHLSRIDVVPGQIIERGQQLGLAGATGRVTGAHLHWGVRIVDARVDPFSLLRIDANSGSALEPAKVGN